MSFQEKTAAAAEKLAAIKIVPVLVLEQVDDGLRMCEILLKNGLPAAEITFRTAAAAKVIQAASKRFPELCLGAGTVLKEADLQAAMDAGAEFAVAPGFNPGVVRRAIAAEFPFAPGVCTPSEVEQALELGCRFLKFFPAEAAGGVKYLSALAAPYRHLGIKFMPTGGISAANVRDYLAIKEVVAAGGTWLGKSADIAAGNWDKIADAVRAAAALTGEAGK